MPTAHTKPEHSIQIQDNRSDANWSWERNTCTRPYPDTVKNTKWWAKCSIGSTWRIAPTLNIAATPRWGFAECCTSTQSQSVATRIVNKPCSIFPRTGVVLMVLAHSVLLVVGTRMGMPSGLVSRPRGRQSWRGRDIPTAHDRTNTYWPEPTPPCPKIAERNKWIGSVPVPPPVPMVPFARQRHPPWHRTSTCRYPIQRMWSWAIPSMVVVHDGHDGHDGWAVTNLWNRVKWSWMRRYMPNPIACRVSFGIHQSVDCHWESQNQFWEPMAMSQWTRSWFAVPRWPPSPWDRHWVMDVRDPAWSPPPSRKWECRYSHISTIVSIGVCVMGKRIPSGTSMYMWLSLVVWWGWTPCCRHHCDHRRYPAQLYKEVWVVATVATVATPPTHRRQDCFHPSCLCCCCCGCDPSVGTGAAKDHRRVPLVSPSEGPHESCALSIRTGTRKRPPLFSVCTLYVRPPRRFAWSTANRQKQWKASILLAFFWCLFDNTHNDGRRRSHQGERHTFFI